MPNASDGNRVHGLFDEIYTQKNVERFFQEYSFSLYLDIKMKLFPILFY